MTLGKTTLVQGDMGIVVCKQGLIFTMTIRLECPLLMLSITGKFSLFLATSFRGTYILYFGLRLAIVQDIKLLPCFPWAPCLILLSFAFIPSSRINLTMCLFMLLWRPRLCMLLMLPFLFSLFCRSVLFFPWMWVLSQYIVLLFFFLLNIFRRIL